MTDQRILTMFYISFSPCPCWLNPFFKRKRTDCEAKHRDPLKRLIPSSNRNMWLSDHVLYTICQNILRSDPLMWQQSYRWCLIDKFTYTLWCWILTLCINCIFFSFILHDHIFIPSYFVFFIFDLACFYAVNDLWTVCSCVCKPTYIWNRITFSPS